MNPASKPSRIRGLDTLRFIAAMWVVFSHFGFLPLFDGVDKTHLPTLIVRGVYGNLFAGPAAVMVFFLISGFCIHYPYCRPDSFQPEPYFARRYLRIGMPMLAAMALARPLHVELHFFQLSILWSLVAELIYYTLYPWLRRLWARFGWGKILSGAYLLALATLCLHPQAPDYDPFGNSLNWIMGLPVWLLGCRLAENIQAAPPLTVSTRQIWSWRLGIWGLASVASGLRFHSPIGYPWTLLAFSGLVYFWVEREIHFFQMNRPWRWLEWMGQWSYSIYLTHLIANAAYQQYLPWQLDKYTYFFIRTGWILAAAYIFYLLVEKPAHLLARWMARALRREPVGAE